MVTVTKGRLDGLIIIEPKVFGDKRGFFMETWRLKDYQDTGLPGFVQDTLSCSKKGVLRGLHFQDPHAQGKLVYVIEGEIWDVAVDLRPNSPTFAQWESQVLSSENNRQFYMPPGFAHGFCVLSDKVLVAYKFSDYYHPECEKGIRWDDPTLNIKWPIKNPSISDRDQKLPTVSIHCALD